MVTLRVKFSYSEQLIKEPIISKIVKDFDVQVNVRKADINDQGGWVTLELIGDSENLESALDWASNKGVEVSILSSELE